MFYPSTDTPEPIDILLETYMRVHTPLSERPTKMRDLRTLSQHYNLPTARYKRMLIENLEPIRKKWSVIHTFIENTLCGKYEECPICYENMDISNYIFTPCSHIFCSNCIFTHLRVKRECPICRKPLCGMNYLSTDLDTNIQTENNNNDNIRSYANSHAVLYVTYVYLPIVMRFFIIYLYFSFLHILFFTDEYKHVIYDLE